MKNISIIVGGIVILIIGVLFICSVPKNFGNNIDASKVHHINVFDGNTGQEFTIDRPSDVMYIVENIQRVKVKRSKISVGYMGFGFRITYMDQNDNEMMPVFYMNSEDTIRKDPFFYRCDGGLCFDYIKGLEPQ